MKKLFTISVAIFVALNVVLGYTGITVFKMICDAEQGKVVTSLFDATGACEHSKPQTDSCCKPSSQKSLPIKTACCDYSHANVKVDDDGAVNQLQLKLNPLFYSFIVYIILPDAYHLKDDGLNTHLQNPPPLLTLRKQSYQSFIQSYLI